MTRREAMKRVSSVRRTAEWVNMNLRRAGSKDSWDWPDQVHPGPMTDKERIEALRGALLWARRLETDARLTRSHVEEFCIAELTRLGAIEQGEPSGT